MVRGRRGAEFEMPNFGLNLRFGQTFPYNKGNIIMKFLSQNSVSNLTLRRPLCRKLRMRWFFDVSKVKESSFFKSDLTDPLRFLMRIFWKVPI